MGEIEKNLLAILGSPRKNGNSARMLACACEQAKKEGWKVQTVFLQEKNIAYCKGCCVCNESRMCVIDDDITELRKQFLSCDLVVLAMPVYWANVPAVVKNMFDRLVGAAMQKTKTFPKPRFSPKQRYLLLVSCDTPPPFSGIFGQSTGALHAAKEFFKTGGMCPAGNVVFAGAGGKKELPASVAKKIQRLIQKA